MCWLAELVALLILCHGESVSQDITGDYLSTCRYQLSQVSPCLPLAPLAL